MEKCIKKILYDFLTYLFVGYLILVLSCSSVTSDYLIYYTTSVSDSVRFDCCNESHQRSDWKYADSFLFLNRNPIDQPFGNSVSVLRNYSLYIKSVSIQHEGSYECLCNLGPFINFSLLVKGLYYTYNRLVLN